MSPSLVILLFSPSLLLFLFSTLPFSHAASSSSSPPNIHNHHRSFRDDPYEILNLPSENVTQKEIQRQYRKLCLQHHPDKKRGNSDSSSPKGVKDKINDADEEDFAFKEIQHAYSLIGTEEDRKNYERKRYLESLLYKRGVRTDDHQHSAESSNYDRDLHRDLFSSATMFGTRPPSGVFFTFGRNGMSFQFSNNSHGNKFYFNPFFGSDGGLSRSGQSRDGPLGPPETKLPHYIQKVTIPLEVLYAGEENFQVTLKTSLFYQYKAAWEGGVLAPILVQGAIAIMFTWMRSQHVNWILSLFLFGMMVHANIPPPPAKAQYLLNIKKGWKHGTKIQYHAATNKENYGAKADVTFVLQEGRHERYTRVGNDLHVNVRMRAKRLKKGCKVAIPPLCRKSDPIELRWKPGEIRHDGQVITVKGRGWPCGDNKYGDLVVKVFII